MNPKIQRSDETITVNEIKMTQMRFNIVGTSPLMPHSASAHAKGQLLFPSPKKNAAERATTMKHDPFREYVDAAYRFTDQEAGKTRLYMPGSCIHAAMKDVAIDMIGAKKAQIGRLTSVPIMKLPLYGIPKINTMMVRSSDMNRTPDIRTLPVLERWALPNVPIRFVHSLIKEASIANLLGNAGIILGIGDGRPQHGYFTFGTFRLVGDDDEELREIMKTGQRAAQDYALKHPEYYDIETESLLTWFLEEQKRRAAAPPKATEPKRRAPKVRVPVRRTKRDGKVLEAH